MHILLVNKENINVDSVRLTPVIDLHLVCDCLQAFLNNNMTVPYTVAPLRFLSSGYITLLFQFPTAERHSTVLLKSDGFYAIIGRAEDVDIILMLLTTFLKTIHLNLQRVKCC